MPLVIEVISWLLALSGGVFVLIGAVGLLRMPNFPTRVHAAGLADIFGTLQILAAIALQYGWSAAAMKIALIMAFIGITSPVAAHAMFRTYHRNYSEE